MKADDMELVRQYVEHQSEGAFAALVSRHTNLVHATALRLVRDPQVSEEVTQAVFIILARKGGSLNKNTILPSWLYRTACFTSISAIKREKRRLQREQEAYMRSTLHEGETEAAWNQISPLLEEAMLKLKQHDRDALVLRFFEGRTLNEVGLALGASEDAAKKRIARALEKIRKYFCKRGVVATTALIAAAISANSVHAADAALAKTVTTAVIAHSATASSSSMALAKGGLKLMAWAKAKTAILLGGGIILAAGTAAVIVNSTTTAASGDIISKLEEQTGKRIVCDNRLNLTNTYVDENLSIEDTLDQLAFEIGGYWSVDYAVYGSDHALQALIKTLQDGAILDSAGWTNLSSRPLEPRIVSMVTRSDKRRSFGGFGVPNLGDFGMITNADKNVVAMSAAVPWNFLASKFQRNEKGAIMIQAGHGPGSANMILETALKQAMESGAAEGVLAPERLLAESGFASKINRAGPLPSTPKAAAQAAKASDAKWITIYTIRKSPIDTAGIKLMHAGEKTKPPQNTTNQITSASDFVERAEEWNFTLTTGEMSAHKAAVQAAKHKQ